MRPALLAVAGLLALFALLAGSLASAGPTLAQGAAAPGVAAPSAPGEEARSAPRSGARSARRPRGGAGERREPSVGQMAARERLKRCGTEWRALGEAEKRAQGPRWPQYYGRCVARLKEQRA